MDFKQLAVKNWSLPDSFIRTLRIIKRINKLPDYKVGGTRGGAGRGELHIGAFCRRSL